ncbi:hypothetical protein FRC01_014169, partial [Tulasnella sp. 417]
DDQVYIISLTMSAFRESLTASTLVSQPPMLPGSRDDNNPVTPFPCPDEQLRRDTKKPLGKRFEQRWGVTYKPVLPIRALFAHANAPPKIPAPTRSCPDPITKQEQSLSKHRDPSSPPLSPTLKITSAVFTSFPGVGRYSQVRTYDEGTGSWVYHSLRDELQEIPAGRSRQGSSATSEGSTVTDTSRTLIMSPEQAFWEIGKSEY